MPNAKATYAHPPSILTDEMLHERGYCTYQDILRVSSKQDQQLTIEQFKDKGRYGTAPGFYRFHGSRLAPVYWKVSEVARYLAARYYNDRALLSRLAKAGFVAEASTSAAAAGMRRGGRGSTPVIKTPIKTLDLPLGGSSSPVDALAVLIDFLTVTNSQQVEDEGAGQFQDDNDGDETIGVLKGGLKIARRITGNAAESLGLHPIVYFTNEKGKHNRFLFLGMCAILSEKLSNNDKGWFKKFTLARAKLEKFLLENKSAIGIVLQNLGKKSRTPKMAQMFDYLVREANAGRKLEAPRVFKHIGLSGKIYDLTLQQKTVQFTDEVKSQIFIRDGISKIQMCPICKGYLDVNKSVSYDHIKPVRDGGLGVAKNGQMVHPYCNTAMKS